MLSLTTLISCGVQPAMARLYLAPLLAACNRFDISTRARISAFLGQCVVESTDFTRTEENLMYSTAERIRAIFPSRVASLADAAKLTRNPKALANRVYAGKNGNGDEASGDGYKFRGRGLIQLTGRANYADAAVGLAAPLVEKPELVALPEHACLTAAWFWHTNKLNLLADASLIDEITRRVNGRAMLHADLRRQRAEEAFGALA